MDKTATGSWAVLRAELLGCEVSVWPLAGGLRLETKPEGTRVRILGPADLRGYVPVLVGTDPVEVWYECLATPKTTYN